MALRDRSGNPMMFQPLFFDVEAKESTLEGRFTIGNGHFMADKFLFQHA